MNDSNHLQPAAFSFRGFQVVRCECAFAHYEATDQPCVSIGLSGELERETGIFDLSVQISITTGHDAPCVQVVSVSRFEFGKPLKLAEVPDYFYVNAPAIVYPYLRAFVSGLTALAGHNQLMLPTLNLSGLNLQKYTTERDEPVG
jgi:preprotein translocase subunit SecB